MTAIKKVLHSGYMTKVFGDRYEEVKKNPLKSAVRSAARKLRGVDFDYIIMTGTSGITFGAALCYCMDKAPIVVRKTTEKSHSPYNIEGYPVSVTSFGGTEETFRAIIVDDFVATGKTIETIKLKIDGYIDQMKSYGNKMLKPTIVGGYFYEKGDYTEDLKAYVAIKKMGG